MKKLLLIALLFSPLFFSGCAFTSTYYEPAVVYGPPVYFVPPPVVVVRPWHPHYHYYHYHRR